MNSPIPKTPRDIIILALRAANVLGVGQDATAEDVNDAFNHLNMMLARWWQMRINVYRLADHSIQCNTARSYTIGPGGDFDMGNVRQIEAAYVSQFRGETTQVDYWLTQIPARESYDRIALKQLQSFPSTFFYDSDYPLGRIFVWPVPDDQYWLTITTREELQRFTNLSDKIVLPDLYQDAIFWNLALRLAVTYGMPVTDDHKLQARSALNDIQNLNAQVPLLTMPSALKSHNGMFNIYGDNYVGGSQ